MSGTTKVLGGAGGSVLASAVVLPNTGGNMVVTIAFAVAAGLITWGVLYATANK